MGITFQTVSYHPNPQDRTPAEPGFALTFMYQKEKWDARRKKRNSEEASITAFLTAVFSDPSYLEAISDMTGITDSVPIIPSFKISEIPDTDACVNNPCQNGGTCIDNIGDDDTPIGRTCECATGFSGESCEINFDDCASNPCRNNFPCIDGANNYACNCSDSSLWSGKNCDTDFFCTQSSPCNEHGSCADATCTCDTGADVNGTIFEWAGPQCSYKNYCLTNSCPIESTCSSDQTGLTCDCNLGYAKFDSIIILTKTFHKNKTSIQHCPSITRFVHRNFNMFAFRLSVIQTSVYGPVWEAGDNGACATYACDNHCPITASCSINDISGAAECE